MLYNGVDLSDIVAVKHGSISEQLYTLQTDKGQTLVLSDRTQLYVETNGVKTIVTAAYLSKNLGPQMATQIKIGMLDGDIVKWVAIQNIHNYTLHLGEELYDIQITGLNRALIIDSLLVR